MFKTRAQRREFRTHRRLLSAQPCLVPELYCTLGPNADG